MIKPAKPQIYNAVEMRKRGFRQTLTEEEINIGECVYSIPIDTRDLKSEAKKSPYKEIECPYCYGPLIEVSRDATDVGRVISDCLDTGHGEFICWVEDMPDTHISVVCLSCDQFFFPLKEHLTAE